MKKNLPIVTVCAVLVSLALCVAAGAAGLQDPAIPGSGPHRAFAKGGPDEVARDVRLNMVAQALAQVTQQPLDTIHQKLRDERLPAVLEEYNVDWKTFSDAMHAKFQDLLGRLVDSNYLTVAQRDHILARMEQHAQRRALMQSLIDKAVKDGTISQDQAQMLLKRPH